MIVLEKNVTRKIFGDLYAGEVFREVMTNLVYIKIDFQGIDISGCRELPNPAALVLQQEYLRKNGGWAVYLASGSLYHFDDNVLVQQILTAKTIV